MRKLSWETISTLTLDELDHYARLSLIRSEDRDRYLTLWNATTGRFTVARWEDGAIRMRDRDSGRVERA